MSLVRERGVDDVLLKQQWAQTKPRTRENTPTVTEAHIPYSNGNFIESHTKKRKTQICSEKYHINTSEIIYASKK